MSDKILIVEDNAMQLMLLQCLLEKVGLQVSVASNGVKALEAIRIEPPALVISDVRMPEMDGIQLCKEIKENSSTSAIPVVMLIGSESASEIEAIRRVGADDFFVKPASAEFIQSMIIPLLDKQCI